MKEILNCTWRTTILFMAALLQVFGAIFQGIANVIGWASKILRGFSNKIVAELDKGKSENIIRDIANVQE